MSADAGALPVSVLLLARDETRDLEALLPTLAFAREVVVVWDPRGDAATRDAATRLGARVFEHAFEGFGPQRQFALAQCREPWVLWIDADERLAPGAERALRESLPGLAADTAVDFTRHGWFLGRRIRGCGWQDESVLRLFPRAGSHFDDASVHERVHVDAARRIGGPPFVLEHHSYPDFEACVTKMVRYAAANAEKAWREGRRAGAFDLLWRPPLRFVRQFVLQAGFRDGAHGLVLCGFAAAQVFLKYAGLWQRGQRDVPGPPAR